MKTWQAYLLVAAVLIAPHLSMNFAIGAALGFVFMAVVIAGGG